MFRYRERKEGEASLGLPAEPVPIMPPPAPVASRESVAPGSPEAIALAADEGFINLDMTSQGRLTVHTGHILAHLVAHSQRALVGDA